MVIKRKTLKQRMRRKGGATEQPSNNDELFKNYKDLLNYSLRKLNKTIDILHDSGATRIKSNLQEISETIHQDFNSYNRPDIVLKQIKTIVNEILKASGFIPEIVGRFRPRQKVLNYVSQIMDSKFAHFKLDESNNINVGILKREWLSENYEAKLFKKQERERMLNNTKTSISGEARSRKKKSPTFSRSSPSRSSPGRSSTGRSSTGHSRSSREPSIWGGHL